MKNENLRGSVLSGIRQSDNRTSTQTVASSKSAIASRQSPYPGYLPIAPVKNDLRVSFSGTAIQVQGLISDHRGRILPGPIRLEIWHLSPNSRKYNHRAITYTNEIGGYLFITDLPNRESGLNYKIYFRISFKDKSYFTHLSFNHCAAFMATRNFEKQLKPSEKKISLEDSLITDQSIIKLNVALPIN